MTPYSGKYLGYAIEKGKLSVSLKYLIDNKQLNSQNDVLIDQFTFGESIDSPDATKLPVRLAVALLRDKDGKIDLHLPVTGRTDDPQFRVGKIIIQMIVNILEKAATSPFALLEALYPGASQLNHIEFEPGRSTLTEDGKKKLSDLITIMGDRPSLSLELKGYVDTTSDRSGLVSILSERKLKAVKLKDILRQGKQASSVDDIVIDPSEYSDYLKKAYKAESFPKPSTFLGIAKSLPDEEMKKLIIEHISVTDDDLKALASARSQQIRDYLMESGKIDPGRIFLIESDPLTPERIDTVANSRVSLTIK
jgi:outer membrane protein OmpA-like peptidoglycan-associated protein